MRTFKFQETKRAHFCFDGEKWFKTNKNYADITFIEVENSTSPFKDCFDFKVEANSLQEAYSKWAEILIAKREDEKQARSKYVDDRAEKMQDLLSLPVIPVTEDNISLVLEYLNSRNWGSWTLPQLTMGYSAHQYDCEGTTITTISLDRPILVCGKMIKHFKSGSKRGHLEKYFAL